MKRLAPNLRAILVTLGVAAAAMLVVGVILPQAAEADRGQRFRPVAQCRAQLDTATRQLRETERELAHYKRAYERLAARTEHRRRGSRAMDQRAFSRLHQQFKDATYKSRRIELMERTLRYGKLTSAQLTALLRLCSYDSGRVEIAAMSYPHVVDRENWISVYDTFDYASSARRLDAKLGFSRR